MDNIRKKKTFKKGEKKWRVSGAWETERAAILEMAHKLNILPKTAVLLYNRGQRDAESAERFLKKETELFYDPFLLTDMERAVERILAALERRERIMIFGDYDVDGVTSTASLYLWLKGAGADVGYYIPNRAGEGYGINKGAIDTFAADGVELMITVDTGITASVEIEYAVGLGLEVIVTDHHECHNGVPSAALAVVNPRREDCRYPFKELAGVGVVFKLLCALELRRGKYTPYESLRHICAQYGDLVAIGTVADVMPLVDENRLIVSIGLKLIESTERPGLAALLEQSGGSDKAKESGRSSDTRAAQKKRKVTSSLIGYVLAPRINAAGRISNASKAVELFLTDSPFRASQIAAELCEINRERQNEENSIISEAFAKLAESHDFERDPVIVLDSDSWHHGVIGIVASRITEHYNLPSILISFEDDIGKGSGRSVKGLNLVEALKSCGDCLVKFGGHELAAGLSIERSRLEEFKRRINDYAREALRDEDLSTTLNIDCELEASEITLEAAGELYLLEPYGIANPVPVFALRDTKVAAIASIGGGRHTRMTLEKDGAQFVAVAFGTAAPDTGIVEGDIVDAAFNLDINDFAGRRTVQLIIRDIRPSRARLAESERRRALYEAMLEGGRLPSGALPLRDDFVKLYTYLRGQTREGREVFTREELAARLCGEEAGVSFGDSEYLRARAALDILDEMGVLCAEEPSGGRIASTVRVRLNHMQTKINLDRSEIYRALKARQ